MPLSTLMFFSTCSTVCSFSAAVAAGVCSGMAMPSLTGEIATSPWTGDDFCARTFAITIKALVQQSVATISLRMFCFISFSECFFENQQDLDREDPALDRLAYNIAPLKGASSENRLWRGNQDRRARE